MAIGVGERDETPVQHRGRRVNGVRRPTGQIGGHTEDQQPTNDGETTGGNRSSRGREANNARDVSGDMTTS